MGKFDGRIDAVFADMAIPQRPGAALLVIDHGEIVYRKCYGIADLETQHPITTDSSFYLASLSKQFTAMAIMLLAERRKLSLCGRTGSGRVAQRIRRAAPALCLSAPVIRRVRSSGANRRSILAMEYYAPVMDALMGHFVYICIFMHLVDVQASIRIYRMVMLRIRHNIMQRQSGDGRYWEQEKCGDQDDTHLSSLLCPMQRPKPRRSGVPVDWTMGQFYRLSLHAGVVRAVGADALEPVAPTKNGRSRAWLKIENPANPAMQRVWEDRF